MCLHERAGGTGSVFVAHENIMLIILAIYAFVLNIVVIMLLET